MSLQVISGHSSVILTRDRPPINLKEMLRQEDSLFIKRVHGFGRG